MTSFFKNLKNNFYYNREQLIKENLISQLSESVKEIQLESNERKEECLEQKECTSTLCTILEAIFLHGLKDSLLWQTLSVISGNDADRRPEPNFWPLLLVFLHAHTIEKIEELSQIRTDIGNCRAWIRLSLNESLISSYLKNIRKNSSALNPYYKSYAFLKDSDQLDIASKILEGLETCVQMNLHINSTLFNQWTVLPLQLAGLYSPPLPSCPIAAGIDVASSLTDDTETIPIPKPLNVNEVFPNSIRNSPFNRNIFNKRDDDLNEEENVKLLLEKVQDEITCDNIHSNRVDTDEKSFENDDDSTNNEQATKPTTISVLSQTVPYQNNSNLVNMATGWSDDFSLESDISGTKIINNEPNTYKNANLGTENSCMKDIKSYGTSKNDQSKLSRSNSISTSITSMKSQCDKYSYDALLIKHEKMHDDHELNMSDVWHSFENSFSLTGENVKELIKNEDDDDDEKQSDFQNDVQNSNQNSVTDEDDFEIEILPKLTNEKFTLSELQKMVEYICKLGREQGLDAQGYMCEGCAHPLGIGFANAHVCSFSGYYFCDQCMSSEQFTIPAKVIYNWDFRKYNVSKRAAIFLTDFQYNPFIDLQNFNPKIYGASEEMANIQSLRIQLNWIRAYLYNCRESSIHALEELVNAKKYLYEHIHRYSIADLTLIPKGQLIRHLQKIYQFGEEHILTCNLCSAKGFICEICDSPNVIYPFHINTTFTCEACNSVFHDYCLNESKPCPKCKRKRERESLPLLEAVHLL
ncbi:uncharacterized protein LOC129613797 [Condylostylus longicornis]|uniref:uncharacterized protein LOC129613797 n=1 Tax=Condylostylus longicornis TaxID=2530218 RepID=UPI00244E4061|nr:uncharacterized protein LOC129613797 [Condylostylus longicornis]